MSVAHDASRSAGSAAGLQETRNTLDLLAAAGREYVGDWVDDDQPGMMMLEGGRHIVAMPNSQEINDKPVFERRHRTADGFRDMICGQLDVRSREGAERDSSWRSPSLPQAKS